MFIDRRISCRRAIFSIMSSVSSQPSYIKHYCNPKTETSNPTNEAANATYQSSLTVLLNSLSSKASQNFSFYNDSSNIGIYSLYLCRGDVSNSTCQTCISFATQDITTRCPSYKSAIIWYDQCMLRYSDVNFLGVASKEPQHTWWNTDRNISAPDQLALNALSLLYDLIANVETIDLLYETGVKEVTLSTGPTNSSGLVQCTRDINVSSCRQCLSGLMDEAKKCCESKIGWRVLAPSCNLRYENYSFTAQPPVTPLPPPLPQSVPAAPQPSTARDNGGKKTTKTVIIAISTVASIAVVATLFGFWFYKYSGGRKHEEERDTSQEIPLRSNFARLRSIQLTDTGMHARDVDDSGEMLYFDLSTILSATNNFSDENKLGEGGFGPVYKGLINGKETAIKRLSMKSKQGELSFEIFWT
nr:cysteine-rich receptor-like protein kinase 25 [Quercus suber]